MAFCGNGSSFSPVWVDKGFTHCFTETVASSILFGIGVVFGCIELIFYKRYSTVVENRFLLCSCLFICQIFLSCILVLEPILNILFHYFWLNPGIVAPYQILSAVFSSLAWLLSIVLIFVERHKILPTIPTRGHGLVLLLFWMMAFFVENMAFISWLSPNWWWQNRNLNKTVEMALWIVRYIGSALLFFIGLRAPGLPKYNYRQMAELAHVQSENDVENPLLGNRGSASAREETNTWKKVGKKFSQMWPLIWPRKSLILQLNVLVCLLLLVLGRVVNLYTPILSKLIVNSLSLKNVTSVGVSHNIMHIPGLEFRWDYILIYVSLWFLQGGGFGSMGLLNNVRSFLWIWVQQYTTKETIVKLFAHLHGLSLRWHLSRKTGSVLSIMDRGTNSVNSILSYVVFQILPTIADILIACFYFLISFNVWFALIVFSTMVLYLVATIVITEWRTKYRREMNALDNERNAKGVDSLLNFETVKYYGAEDFEVQRYQNAIINYQKAEFQSSATLNILNTAQNLVITLGLMSGSLLCAWYVYNGEGFTVGDYALFSAYIIQLYQPLNFFGTYYRMIQQAFVDMENMFDLLDEKPEIADTSNAPDLVVSKGVIEFNNVNFCYEPSKPILKNVTFVVPSGQTYALVGHSGSGKSTIVRLLFRFYEIQSGTIRIDGQDITQVRQKSLRKAIGVVPQDTVLFNSDIRYNIRYGRVTASDEEVEEAAKAAEIHSRILSFPDKYNTKVGERGLKLSGGEKQRVAIARTILKAPMFVLLDEATSALDTQTERNIQASLAKVCENRTTLVVAHRLSTIVNADQILVLREGEIIERGTHEALLASGGLYASMWQQQLTKSDVELSTNGSDDAGPSINGVSKKLNNNPHSNKTT